VTKVSLKQFAPAKVSELVASAGRSPMSAPDVEYPDWYLHRWHVLPEGYLSHRSVRLYDRIIRPLYHTGQEARELRALHGLVRRLQPAGIVEFGCGTGRALETVREGAPGAAVVGVDLSPFMLEAARAGLGAPPEVDLRHGSVERVDLPSASMDLVVAIHLFGHLPLDAARAAIGEAARLLRPGGRLFAIDHRWHRMPFAEAGLRLTAVRRCGARFSAMRVLRRAGEADSAATPVADLPGYETEGRKPRERTE
jgi:SAM-dependent methyltransferase